MEIGFLVLHMIVCVVIGRKLHTKKAKTRALVYPVVVFVPVIGALIYLADEWLLKKNKFGSKEMGLEKLKISDARYKSIQVEREDHSQLVVPLEEAIAVNDAKTRRKLMLDILHRNPEEHIELLQRARMTDDTELTHYATTTMMEIQSGYEQVIRELEREWEVREATGEDRALRKALRRLRKELELYINSGLITGNILNIYRRKLDGVLERLIQMEPENKNYCLAKVENEIEQGELDGVEERLWEMKEKWKEEESVYRLLVRFYETTHQGEKIQQVLEEIENEEIYLSSEGKKWLSFWKK